MTPIFKRLKDIIVSALMILLLLLSLLLISSRTTIAGLSSFVVLTGSMNPSIAAGDIVIVKKVPATTIQKGSIILFDDPNNAGRKVTHRVVEVKTTGNNQQYITKGDANTSPDEWEIASDHILGTVQFAIPKLGYLISFVKTLPGFLLFIILPGIIIIVSELVALLRYVRQLEAKAKHVEVLT